MNRCCSAPVAARVADKRRVGASCADRARAARTAYRWQAMTLAVAAVARPENLSRVAGLSHRAAMAAEIPGLRPAQALSGSFRVGRGEGNSPARSLYLEARAAQLASQVRRRRALPIGRR